VTLPLAINSQQQICSILLPSFNGSEPIGGSRLPVGGSSAQGSTCSFSKPTADPSEMNSGLPRKNKGLSGQSIAYSGFTHLPPRALEDFRAKELCFRGMKSFTPWHDYPFKQLRMLLLLADEDEELNLKLFEYCEVKRKELMDEQEELFE